MAALATVQMTDAHAAADLRRAASLITEAERIVKHVTSASRTAADVVNDLIPHHVTAYGLVTCAEELESAAAVTRRAA